LIHDRRTLEILQSFQPKAWNGIVFRHMFRDFPPNRENKLGARWNPKGVPAIYTSLDRETVIAEAEYQIQMQPERPSVSRNVYRLSIILGKTLDLSDWSSLAQFGIKKQPFITAGYPCCQMIGAGAEWLGHDGMLVPSARNDGINLVIFPNKCSSNYGLEVIDREQID
jgi:RES domain-containing protein